MKPAHPKVKMAATDDPLVGLFLHTFTPSGDVQWQAKVIAKVSERCYLLQMFSWLMGEEIHLQIETLDTLSTARFYETIEHWRNEGDHLSKIAERRTRVLPEPKLESF